MTPKLTDLERMARAAGTILKGGFITRPGFELGHQIEYKGEIDLVTEMDRRSESFLIAEIKRRYPHDCILSEEAGELPGRNGRAWYIDPLDGTTNYAHGLPIYSISLAYAEQGQMRLGVVYDPTLDECFSAEKGAGARLNGEPIRVSMASRLDQSLLVTGFSYDIHNTTEDNFDQFQQFLLRAQSVRRLGSAAIDLCNVAAGRLDGFWELKIFPWDLAAGGLIATEAGALVTDTRGGADYLRQPCSVLAANAAIHEQMLAVLKGIRGQKK